jgi:hypothetical protein
VTLIITADGHRLLLFAIFRRKTLPKGKFPQAITARASMDDRRAHKMVECGVKKAARCLVTQARHVGFKQLLWTHDRKAEIRS